MTALYERVIPNLPDEHGIAASLQTWRSTYPTFDTHLQAGIVPSRAVRGLALSTWGLGDIGLAAEMLKVAAALAPKDAWILSDLSSALATIGQVDDARQYLRLALEHDPGQAQRWLLLAGYSMQCDDATGAEAALHQAIRVDPAFDTAWISLGMLCLKGKRFADAVHAFRVGIDLGNSGDLVHACFGEALFQVGDVAASAEAYRREFEKGIKDAKVFQKYCFSQLLESLLDQAPEAAYVHYRQIAGDKAETHVAAINKAMHALSGYGHHAAALKCADYLLIHSPDDPIVRYLATALRGSVATRAPDDYIVSFFDQFSDTFEHQLVDVLKYRIPEKIRDALNDRRFPFRTCLDAGCGTGLMGQLIHAPGREITGVDLSSGMLAKAAERGVYSSLVEAEIHGFFAASDRTYDLVIAADVLVYIGDLEDFFAGAARCLNRGGLLIVSIETTNESDFKVLPSGRFAHQLSYISRITAGRFVVEREIPTEIRLDAQGAAYGAILLLRLAPS